MIFGFTRRVKCNYSMEMIIIVLSAVIVILAFVAASMYRRQCRAADSVIDYARKESDYRATISRLETELAVSRQQREWLDLKQEEMARREQARQQELVAQSETRFRLLANELFKSHADEMTRTSESNIGRLLTPLKDDIERFRHDVTSFYGKEAAERLSLQERIRELIEANNSIGREARELSNALRANSKVQGDWGEVVLERILENSGLRRDQEFLVQTQTDIDGRVLRDEEGNALRPDVVVKYPGGRVMIIDSKVSLTAFVEYVNCEDDSERAHYGKLHLSSVVKHINELSAKNYQDYVGRERLDFVMMFIPNESAYAAAMTLDPALWQKAYDKRVLMVSPTQLVASLKIVHQLWVQDRQTKNAIDIAERSGAMYDKFVGFVADMERIEKALDSTHAAYDSAMKKLRDGTGSLIVRAEKLRELGIKATKRMPKSSDS